MSALTFRWAWGHPDPDKEARVRDYYASHGYFTRKGVELCSKSLGESYFTPQYTGGEWTVHESFWKDDSLDNAAYDVGLTFAHEKDCEEWVRRARRR